MKNKTKITIVGSGYVGMSLAVLLAQHNDVVVLDIDPSRVDKINSRESTVEDNDINDFLSKKKLSLTATLDREHAYENASFIVIATPTNYDAEINKFDTSSVDNVICEVLNINSNALVVIKSTIPIRHTKLLQKKHKTERIIFSPEFLREGQALNDNLYPSRIIIGSKLSAAKEFANLLINGARKKDIETLFMDPTEAEAVKLFANSYLAMRISFINEIDSFSLIHDLDPNNIIKGICLDKRIGDGYNNPSFGYGGYCLPKDTKQLLANFDKVPQKLIQAIVSSNAVRKNLIADTIIKLNPKVVGIYRLIMKEGSDNFRDSAVQEVIDKIKSRRIKIIIYEPTLKEDKFLDLSVIKSLDEFKDMSEIILSNRMNKDLNDIKEKVFTRDLYGRD